MTFDATPFEELIAPLALSAVQRLDARDVDGRISVLFAPEGVSALARRLHERVTAILLPALWHEFSRRRSSSPVDELLRRAGLPDGDGLYRAFAAEGLAGHFARYPVLSRLVDTAVEQWTDGVFELVERLERDRTELARLFPECGGRIVGIGPEKSDPHRGGRTVAVLVWESGASLVYKCRSVGMEAGYAAVLRFCNERGELPFELRVLRVLDRGDHGYVEHVKAAPCASAEAAARFYFRGGMQACLLHALRATDCHADNWIAEGEHPVLLDAETLLAPERPAAGPGDAVVRRSVLATAVLPCWQYDEAAGVLWDSGGLGAAPGDGAVERRVAWRYVNTDAMHLGFEDGAVEAPAVPRLDGRPLAPGPYMTTVVAGFREMYGFLLRHRVALGAEAGPFARLEAGSARVVLRPTAVYKALLRVALLPEHLVNDAARSRAFAVLGDAPDDAFVAEEVSALEQMDVPYFTARARRSALDELGTEDLEHQVSAVQGAFFAHGARLGTPVDRDVPAAPEGLPDGTCDLSGAAEALGRALTDHAYWESGTPVWMGPVLLAAAERFQWGDIGEDLYDGRAGVAVFFAALDAHGATDAHRPLVDGALRPIRARLIASGVGGGKGIGSHIYALTLVSRFTGELSYLSDALALAGTLTDDAVSAAPLGVLAGRAGAVLSLLALHRATGEPRLLLSAAALGQRLARSLEDDAPPEPGFATGSAGIAHALVHLHACTGDPELLAAARAVMPRAAPDLAGWCKGPVGVALARIAARDVLGVELPVPPPAAASAVDSLCCGEAAAIELDLVASRVFAQPELAGRARRRAASLVARAERDGGHRVFAPGFFPGGSGIGYTLLRALAPARFPCVALWE